jgi:hypothetical protein
MIDPRQVLRNMVATVKTCRMHDLDSSTASAGPVVEYPNELMRDVLRFCVQDLGLPPDMRLEWSSTLGDRPTYFDGTTPTVIYLSDKHLRSEFRWLIPQHVAHECQHAYDNLGVRAGRLPIGVVLDDELNEARAVAYSRKVGQRWGHD